MDITYKCPKCEDVVMEAKDDEHVCTECSHTLKTEEAEKLFESGDIVGVVDSETADKMIEEAQKKKMKKESDDEEDDDSEDKDKKKAKKVEIDVEEDMNAIFNGEELTEEFKTKVATIYEASLKANVKAETERLEAHFAEELEAKTKAVYESVDGKVSEYMDHVVTEWMEENKLAIESGRRIEAANNVLEGLSGLLKENNLEVPEGREDLVEQLAKEASENKAKLDEEITKRIALEKEVNESKRAKLVESLSEGLTDVDQGKFTTLVEEIKFDSEEDFETKAKTIKENYFNKKSASANTDEQDLNEDDNNVSEDSLVNDVVKLLNKK